MSKSIEGLTHYLGDKTILDVSSEDPLRRINSPKGPSLETSNSVLLLG